MKHKATALSDAARDVLVRSTVIGMELRLPPGQLDRATYVSVNAALEALGGKWNKKAGAHLFSADPTVKLAELLGTGVVPAKNPLAFYSTPVAVTDAMVRLAAVDRQDAGLRILEPSAGTGALALRVMEAFPAATMHCVEVDPERSVACERVEEKGIAAVWCSDFRTWARDSVSYDLVVMNPPFVVEDDAAAWMIHVRLAYNLLARHGVLVAVLPNSYVHRSDKRHVAFREWAEERGAVVQEIPPEAFAFAESGTGVSTILLRLEAA